MSQKRAKVFEVDQLNTSFLSNIFVLLFMNFEINSRELLSETGFYRCGLNFLAIGLYTKTLNVSYKKLRRN